MNGSAGIGRWSALLVVLAVGRIAAEDGYLVPAHPAPIRFSCPGLVDADRSDMPFVALQAQRVAVSWLGIDGRYAGTGDPLVAFDTSELAAWLPVRREELRQADVQLAIERLRMEDELARLEEERQGLRAELAASRARLAALGSDDARLAGEARASATAAALDAAEAQRLAAREMALAASGDQSADLAAQQQEQARRLALAARKADLEARRIAATDRSLEREKLVSQVRDLELRLGLDAEGREDPSAGLGGRILSARARIGEQGLRAEQDRDQRRRELLQLERDLADCTPVDRIEVLDAAGERRLAVDFAPAPLPPAPGFTADRGEPFSGEHGWDADRSNCLRADPPFGGGEATGVVLAPGGSSWRCRLPSGAYTVRLRLGDGWERDGCLLRIGGSEPWCANRISAGEHPVVERQVQIADGELVLRFGDALVKALRATSPCLVVHRPGLAVGQRFNRSWNRPLVSCADPARLRIVARVHQDLAALLRSEDAAPVGGGEASDAARARLACSRVTVVTGEGRRLSATVARVLNKPVTARRGQEGWNEEGAEAADQVWREVQVTLHPADARSLCLGTSARVEAEIPCPPGIVTLPVHLVSITEAGCAVQEVGHPLPTPVEAFRAGDQVVVVSGLAPGRRLRPPLRTAGIEAGGGAPGLTFPGQVVTGHRAIIVAPQVWGRVQELLPDGTTVRAGDQVMALYNPWLDQERSRMEQDRIRAEINRSVAAEQRRTRILQAADARADLVKRERLARLDLAEAARPDPWGVAVGALDLEDALASQAWLEGRLAGLRRLERGEAGTLAMAEAEAGVMAIAVERARLASARAARSADALQLERLRGTWRSCIEAIAQREDEDALMRAELSIQEVREELARSRSSWMLRFKREFDAARIIRSGADGRLQWFTSWSDVVSRHVTMQRDNWVWSGLRLAEVVDLRHPAFEAELPEDWYPRLRPGQEVALVFPRLNRLRLPGRIERIGQVLNRPRDTRDQVAVAMRRVFTLRISFAAPPDQLDSFVPGNKGLLELPPPTAPGSEP